MRKFGGVGIKEPSRRRRAEEIIQEKTVNLDEFSTADVQSLIHELHAHRTELEMQNEKLRFAQIEIEKSRNKYADLYDFAPIGYFTLDIKGLIQEINLTNAALVGVERLHLINKPFSHYIYKEDQDLFYLYIKQLLDSTTKQSCELRIIGKGKTTFNVQLDGIAIFDKDKNFRHFRITMLDITERKQAEKLLRNSEERFRALYENNPLICFTVDTEGRILHVNQFGVEQLGYAVEELVGHSVLNVFYEEDKKAVLEQLTMCLQNPTKVARWELRKIRKDGEMLWVREVARTMRDINGSTVILIICEDVNECKLAEQTLRESEERFRIVADNAPVMLWMTGSDKLCNYVNKGWLEFKGRSVEEELGNGWAEGIHPDDLEHCLNTYLTAFDDRQEFNVEYRLKRHDGEYRWIQAHGVPRFTVGNTFIGYIGCCEDTTDRKLVMELQQERLRFESMLSEISSRFLYLAPNEIDSGIEQCLKDLVGFLGYDRGSIALFSEGMRKFYITHTYACPGFEPPPKGDFAAIFPWYTDMLKKGETLVFSNLPYDLPDEATAEREYCIKGGFKSHFAIPLKVGDSTLGAIGFGSYSSNKSCPKELIQRLKIIGEIFAYAMLRKQALDVILHRDNLLQTIFNSISSHVVVLDGEGNIIYTSRSWEEFARDNHGDTNRVMVGVNYLDVCQKAAAGNDQSAQEVLQGIRAVLDRKLPNFSFEYPCHSSTVQRWYLMHVDPMPPLHGGVVISHINITDRKKPEQELKKALIEIKKLKNQLQAENIYLREEIKLESSYDEIVGTSRAIKSVLSQAEQVASTDSTVLLYGETGTGKELIARAIHKLSPRKGRALIKVNCAALPSTLIEAELFGREKGAYTGALTKQIGRFEMANGSTIFLDEISELSLELQSKLLRVLQEGEFERLGSPQTVKVDVRVIAATNRDLSKAMEDGNFREDLYYRLNVFPIYIPPLWERKEDIPMLVWAFVKEFSEKMGKRIETIPKKNMEALQLYPWHGNVRELRNVIERSMILTKGTTLVVDLPKSQNAKSYQNITLEDMERRHITDALETTNWRIRGSGGASEILGLKPSTLESKMVKLGIQRKK